jgi:SAM-dependent methyltransferase
MQTKAEKYLIKAIKEELKKPKKDWHLINLGAAKSVVIEEELNKEGISFIADRCDVNDCKRSESFVGQSFICSLEKITEIVDNNYDLAWANFVFEHLENPKLASQEIYRILKKEGILVISLSNPQAPEFILAKLTPTWFHQLFRKADHDEAYPVKYAYKNLNNLIKIIEETGFKLKTEKYIAFTYGYLYRWPIIRHLSCFYDYILESLNLKKIKSHAVLIFKK